MLEKLKQVEKQMAEFLKDEDDWNSLLVDYDKPHVWRLWRQIDDEHRVLLHKIQPCEEGEALPHPHPWPSAVKLFTPPPAGYETGVGWASPEAADPPHMPAKFVLQTASTYEMTDPRAWHYVRPIGAPIYSIMVIGPLFDVPKQKRFGWRAPLGRLNKAQQDDLFSFFRNFYKSW